jgi:iron complex outermembrane receptor protein
MKTRREFASGWATIVALAAVLPAVALSDAPKPLLTAAVNADYLALDEVVVNARKREENALDVPISISSVTGSTLDRDQDYSIQDLAEKVPNLLIAPSNPRQTSIAIRGLGKNSANDGLETSVGVYVDGVYLSQPGETTFDLADLDHVEVLRGPQGTLFGKNNTGGVVNISTLKPSFAPSAKLEAIGGDYGTFELHASATGPLSDTTAYRLTVYDRQRDGFLKNLYDGSTFNGFNRQGVRGQLLFVPDDTLTFRVILEHYQSSELTGGSVLWLSNPVYSSGVPINKTLGSKTAALGFIPVFDPWSRSIDLNSARPVKTQQDAASIQTTWKLGSYTIDSITAFRHYTFDAKNDGDNTPLDIVDFNGTTSDNKQYSEELRLASPIGERLDYVGGLYFYHDRLWSNSDQLNGTEYAAFNHIVVADPGAIDGVLQNTVGTPVVDSYAAFAQANVHFADNWTFTAGARETSEHKSASIVNTVSGGSDPAALSPSDLDARLANIDTSTASTAFSDRALSYLGSIAYRVNDDVNTFFTVSKGFKSGGINIEVTNVPLVVAPETAIDFEAGFKSKWLADRLHLNGDVYDSKIHDYQGNFQSNSPSLGNYIANVGDVRVRGFEIEADVLPIDSLRISGGGSYNQATYLNFRNAACPVEQPASQKTCDFSGRQLPFAPRWTGEATAQYTGHVRSGLSAYARGNLVFRSSENVNASLSQYGERAAYTVTNVQAGITGAVGGHSYDVSFWARNVFDTRYVTSIGTASGSKSLIAALGDPRTIGATVRIMF